MGVKTQIWIAICAYVIVPIAKKSRSKAILYEILWVVSINVFGKSPIENLFGKPIQQTVKELFSSHQLNIFE